MADNAKATASADLGYELVVRHAFMDYQIGDRIWTQPKSRRF
jgi:hypothetical protein